MNSLLFFLFFISFAAPTSTSVTKKLDQTLVPQEPDAGIKCGSCPCVNPCSQSPPPPPPPSPPPPKTPYCTPTAPPPPRFYYVTNVPGNGNLYVTDPNENWYYFGSATHNAGDLWLLFLIGLGVGFLHMIIIW